MPHYGDRAERSSASSRTKSGDGRASDESIREATHNSLEQAEELGCESVVVPVLGTGAAGYSFEEGAVCVCEEIQEYEPTTLSDVRVIAYSQNEYETLERIADEVRQS